MASIESSTQADKTNDEILFICYYKLWKKCDTNNVQNISNGCALTAEIISHFSHYLSHHYA